jgi:protein dispatched 1
MPSERAFLTSAFQGMTIATVFAFIILLIATRNVIQAFFSLVSVGIVIVSVLCIMYLQGWEIGISESISMVILIGFSVDYVVHLSADYMHSPCSERSDKM